MIAGGREWLRVLERRVLEAFEDLRQALENERMSAEDLGRARDGLLECEARLDEVRNRKGERMQAFALDEWARFDAAARAKLDAAKERLHATERAAKHATEIADRKRDALATLRAEVKALEKHLDETERDEAKAKARRSDRAF